MAVDHPYARELGDFLRARRGRLRPQDVGLEPGPRRKVAGLRREEVALLAGLSTDYYQRMEQGREVRPSGEVIDGLASGLEQQPCGQWRRETPFDHQRKLRRAYGWKDFVSVEPEFVAWVAARSWTSGDGPKIAEASASVASIWESIATADGSSAQPAGSAR
ncbi:helix-turn-helix domain-containing protein [Microbispora sp. NBC_01189]|uniref:helix-turn-helix domain-containing protein n=1 Tax=Microbispora sp. NBC_01189 TaxID=2903583 RepID=UPI002E12C834